MTTHKFLFISALLIMLAGPLFAQDTEDPASNYKTALALNNEGKGAEAIPYLEKVIKTQSNYTNGAYSLLGSIYDKSNQPEKAIEVFKEGLTVYPTDQSLYFNLGISNFRAKNYADAELAAIEAIKLDTKHANSQRLYGLVTFHQNKRLNALLSFCSYLLIEPNGQRSDEAITNIQSILKGGALRGGSPLKGPSAEARESIAFNGIINQAIASGRAKSLSGANLLEYQLKTIFTQAGQLSAKKTDKAFLDNYYIAFFYNMAQSGQVLGLVKIISTKVADTALTNWVKDTERAF